MVPLPPSVNHQYVHGRGRVVLTNGGRAYRDGVAWQVRGERGSGVPEEAALGVVAWLYFGGGGGDTDNRAMLLLDAVAMGLGIDDGRFHRVYLERRRDVGWPRAEVLVWWRAGAG